MPKKFNNVQEASDFINSVVDDRISKSKSLKEKGYTESWRDENNSAQYYARLMMNVMQSLKPEGNILGLDYKKQEDFLAATKFLIENSSVSREYVQELQHTFETGLSDKINNYQSAKDEEKAHFNKLTDVSGLKKASEQKIEQTSEKSLNLYDNAKLFAGTALVSGVAIGMPSGAAAFVITLAITSNPVLAGIIAGAVLLAVPAVAATAVVGAKLAVGFAVIGDEVLKTESKNLAKQTYQALRIGLGLDDKANELEDKKLLKQYESESVQRLVKGLEGSFEKAKSGQQQTFNFPHPGGAQGQPMSNIQPPRPPSGSFAPVNPGGSQPPANFGRDGGQVMHQSQQQIAPAAPQKPLPPSPPRETVAPGAGAAGQPTVQQVNDVPKPQGTTPSETTAAQPNNQQQQRTGYFKEPQSELGRTGQAAIDKVDQEFATSHDPKNYDADYEQTLKHAYYKGLQEAGALDALNDSSKGIFQVSYELEEAKLAKEAKATQASQPDAASTVNRGIAPQNETAAVMTSPNVGVKPAVEPTPQSPTVEVVEHLSDEAFGQEFDKIINQFDNIDFDFNFPEENIDVARKDGSTPLGETLEVNASVTDETKGLGKPEETRKADAQANVSGQKKDDGINLQPK